MELKAKKSQKIVKQGYLRHPPRNAFTDIQRVQAGGGINAVAGRLRLSWAKSVFVGGNLSVALLFAYPTFSWGALALMLTLMIPTLWLGHSVGFHRLLVHRSFATHPWLQALLALLGTLVGMGGLYDVIRLHEERDWAQQQPSCHPYFSHKLGFWRDALAQLFARFEFDHGPTIDLSGDRTHALDLLQKYWLLTHLLMAAGLYVLGGWAFVVWGLSVRVVLSLFGHWTVVYLSHTYGSVPLPMDGAAVQGHNIPWLSWLSFGESWHCYHHAYPRSAKLDLHTKWQDPSYLAICGLEKLGLAWDILTPKTFRKDER